jgi:hypothetical protein
MRSRDARRIAYAAAVFSAAVCCVLTFAECWSSARDVPLDEARLVRGGSQHAGVTTMTDCLVQTPYCTGSGDTIFCSAQTCLFCSGGANWPVLEGGSREPAPKAVDCPIGVWSGTCDAPASGNGACSCSLPMGREIPACGQYQQNQWNVSEGPIV